MQSQKFFTFLISLALCFLLGACGTLSVVGARPIPSTQTPILPTETGGSVSGVAVVESLEIQMHELSPVQVNILAKGYLAESCTIIQGTAQVLQERRFTLSIITTRPPGVDCLQQIQPFEINTSLDVHGLPAGDYIVDMGGVTGSFTLAQDNTSAEQLANISGLVWHDLCAVGGGEGGAALTPTDGCKSVGNSYQANGLLETGEPGLGGVLVRLGEGSCPVIGRAETKTHSDGSFSFADLKPGVYCVSIEPLDPQNVPLLIPGDWSFPSESKGKGLASFSITLTSGEDKRDLNFGWDYQFLPTPPQIPTPTASVTPTPTPIPIPCDAAKFVSDVTVPDNTSFASGTIFKKTWRLQNAGTCSWTSDYDLVFVSGNAMTDKVTYALPQTVKPGETLDLSVDMTAPNSTGSHKGSWMLKNSNGDYFGLGKSADQAFWVLINVISPNKNYSYDFATNYCLAEWQSDSGKLACPGSTRGSKGFVVLLTDPSLENRKENELTLWLRPNHDAEGWISGKYPPIFIQDGDRFKAWVGCLDDSQGCDVNFALSYQANGGTQKILAEWSEKFDGEVTVVDVDLSFLVGQSVAFTLSAEINNAKFDMANAFWFAPRIDNKKSNEDSGPAVQGAKKMVASGLGISINDLDVIGVEGPLTWKDTCLGVRLDELVCVDATIRGYRVILKHGKVTYEAHTNLDGSIVYWFYSAGG